jgi:hypothetical protein
MNPENSSKKIKYVDRNVSVKNYKCENTAAKIKPGTSNVKVLQPIP